MKICPLRLWNGEERKWVLLRRLDETTSRFHLARHSPTSSSSEVNFGLLAKNLNCKHNLSIVICLISKLSLIDSAPDTLIFNIGRLQNGKHEQGSKMQSYSFISLPILLLLSGFKCICVYFCIFDLFFQLTLLKFISAMHSGACYQISCSKNILQKWIS